MNTKPVIWPVVMTPQSIKCDDDIFLIFCHFNESNTTVDHMLFQRSWQIDYMDIAYVRGYNLYQTSNRRCNKLSTVSISVNIRSRLTETCLGWKILYSTALRGRKLSTDIFWLQLKEQLSRAPLCVVSCLASVHSEQKILKLLSLNWRKSISHIITLLGLLKSLVTNSKHCCILSQWAGVWWHCFNWPVSPGSVWIYRQHLPWLMSSAGHWYITLKTLNIDICSCFFLFEV